MERSRLREDAALGPALFAGAIGVTASDQIGLRQIGAPLPALLIDQRPQPRAISTSFDPKIRYPARRLACAASSPAFPAVSPPPRMRAAIGLSCSSSSSADSPDRLVEQSDLLGKGIAEKA